MKRSRTKNVAKKTADKNLNVIAEDVHTNREVDIVGIPDSSVIKAHDDIAMDEEEEDDVSFDPPLHSTAVYTDADEPLEKDLHEERPREEQSLSSSVRKGKSRSTSSKSKTAESSEDHTAQENTVIEKTKKKTLNKAKSLVQAAESSHRCESPNKISGKATSKLHTPGKTNRSRIKIYDFLTPNKKKIDTKHGQSAERIDEEEEENVLRRPSQAKKRRKKISEGANKGEVEVEDNSETPGQTKKRRRKVKNATPNKAKYQVQTDVVECSASQDEASNRSQPLGQAKKRRRKSSDEAGSPKSKTPKRMQNTSLTPDSSVSGLTNTVPIKVWRSKEMPRSSRDLNEFDVVLSEFEEIVEEYRDAIDSSACKKAVDMFFNSFKEQLTASIEDSHKLKNLKRQNTKLQLEIGKMRKKLIHVREELIENEPKLKKLQKEYAEQEEQKSCLNKAHSFLDNLKELQNNYMAFKAQHPGTRETYGMSSIAALLQQSETIFRAESHFQNINAKLQSFVDQQKKNDMVSS
ncbi:centromere protein U isoform X2 [Xenopus laevis]|uniref:Centromere protein U n=1 Tax=Xenopus laevis TaxID=8355 RepID=A0A8J1MU50_XENLA|nr:centromere protein U isoform X2 [Xenopus laevis]XP_041444990.1 centromere protein U isoform X2 [Xenopus laevis]XP_041444991.1 centromere protein U isoform X2 [Xenopus laevis]XP_041444992.1 centromere protein U isoform X2 [Xenopus laevis]XP_041444993.1 centromere protein U isoform X2 [Xenopus laevis]